MKRFQLTTRKTLVVPTAPGCLLLVLALAAAGFLLAPVYHDWLAVDRPYNKGLLVVEGWIQDYLVKDIKKRVAEHPYQAVICAGGPTEFAEDLLPAPTMAEIIELRLRADGWTGCPLVVAPAPRAKRDRTWVSVKSVYARIQETYPDIKTIDVFSLGIHARRSRKAYRQVFGDDFQVGIIAAPHQHYSARTWWKSSLGFKDVLSETISTVYHALLHAWQGKVFLLLIVGIPGTAWLVKQRKRGRPEA